MAFESGVKAHTFEAASSGLNGKQYYLSALNSSGKAIVVATNGGFALGVIQNNPRAEADAPVSIGYDGIMKVVVKSGETLAPNDFFGAENDGTATKIDATSTGADTGDHILGYVLEGATGPALATVLFRPIGRVTA